MSYKCYKKVRITSAEKIRKNIFPEILDIGLADNNSVQWTHKLSRYNSS